MQAPLAETDDAKLELVVPFHYAAGAA